MHDTIPNYIRETIYALYCGTPITSELSPKLEFTDPLVRVQDGPSNLKMFQRLNAMFPHTDIVRFEPTRLGEERITFDFEVIYRRKLGQRGQRICSTLTVAGNGKQVTHIQEDWKAPLSIKAESLTILHPLRRLFGKVCTL